MMTKPRILFCNESSVLNTGYSVYGREVIRRVWQTGKYEVAEFASYIHRGDPRIKNIPWMVYSNLPDRDNEAEVDAYNSDPINQFGKWKFEEVCLDFIPHIVVDWRDNWMCSYEESSPLRKYYNLVWMPTVDAECQNKEWLSMYASVDGVFTYQDWSLQILKKEANGTINLLGAAPPCADKKFQPMNNREELKKSFGLAGKNIIGTVMRNQRRKLFPNLFLSFRKYLDQTNDNNTLLYCHTSYPDKGWDIPELLMEYGLSSKVLFTYVCRDCGHAFPSLFNDALMYCISCGSLAAGCSNVQDGVPNDILAMIYNMFDLYVQYANSEGFGMPAVEAAACGVPVMEVDYSAMSDVVRKLNGQPIKVLTKYKELETGCMRAVPDDEYFCQQLINFFSLPQEEREELSKLSRQGYVTYYNWDDTADKWMRYFDSVDVEKYEKGWKSEPKITIPPESIPQNMDNINFVEVLIREVLGEPDRLNTYMAANLIRDLNYEYTRNIDKSLRPFTREDAINKIMNMVDNKNYWEFRRKAKLSL